MRQKIILIAILVVCFMLGLGGSTMAATAPSLGVAASYAVWGKAGVTNDPAIGTRIWGNVGADLIGNITNLLVGGGVANGRVDGTIDVGAGVAAAVGPGAGAYGELATWGGTLQSLAGTITLEPGVYDVGAVALDGTVTLSGAGVYIFRSTSSLPVSVGAKIVLTNGADACNVFWRMVAGMTIGGGAQMVGTIISDTAITLGAGASLTGRAFSQSAQVTLINNQITEPVCAVASTTGTLHVVKSIVGGGPAAASDFNLSVKLGGVNVAGSPASGTVTPGTLYTLNAGTYVVSENANASYTPSFSGDCNAGGSVTLAASDNKTCEIINTYIPPATVTGTLHVIKLVVNGGHGGLGTGVSADFTVYVKTSTGANVAGSPASGTAGLGTLYTLAAGTYTVSEDVHTGYTSIFSTDCNASGNVTITGTDKICTITNTDIPVVSRGGGGSSCVVPLVGILKVPTPLALPAGSGSVTYNYTVWNVGKQQALTNVTVTDDKCGPVTLLSGDLNHNNKLDINETWKYSCTSTLLATTINTAIATAHSDDSCNQVAIATVVSTVVVGSSLPPPLISIVKVPSQLTPFPVGGGDVKYTYTVLNPGVVAMHDVTVTDDKCSPLILRTSSDINHNHLLDVTEKRIYTCSTNIQDSTRNVATAKGEANGFTALAYAFANVLVSAPDHPAAPGLPKTGLPVESEYTPWNMVVLASFFMVISSGVILIFRKRKI